MDEQPDQPLTEAEVDAYLKSMGVSPTGEDKFNVHRFLDNVAKASDTTKTGNLTEEELGMPKLPARTYKELALFCDDVANMDYFSDYFRKKAEILTSTSLSKDAKLITLAISQMRNITQRLKTKQQNKGWFSKKKPEEETEV